MNVSRGLLRAWVVVSVLYVAATTRLAVEIWRESVKRSEAAAAAPPARVASSDSTQRLPDSEASFKKPAPPAANAPPAAPFDPFAAAGFVPVPDEQPAAPAQPAKSEFDPFAAAGLVVVPDEKPATAPPPPSQTDVWRAAIPSVAVVVVPPLALLVFGLAVRWVVRGFRASPN